MIFVCAVGTVGKQTTETSLLQSSDGRKEVQCSRWVLLMYGLTQHSCSVDQDGQTFKYPENRNRVMFTMKFQTQTLSFTLDKTVAGQRKRFSISFSYAVAVLSHMQLPFIFSLLPLFCRCLQPFCHCNRLSSFSISFILSVWRFASFLLFHSNLAAVPCYPC